jgi:hypothetical protein
MSSTEPNEQLTWLENQKLKTARWQSASGSALPKKVVIADDTMAANAAYKLTCEGAALLWRGDFHQGRQMVQALGRRIDNARARNEGKADATPRENYYAYRQHQAQRARVLGLVVVELAEDYSIDLRRAKRANKPGASRLAKAASSRCANSWASSRHSSGAKRVWIFLR